MALTYYLRSKMGPYISVTFPPQTAVISRATRPIPCSFIFTLIFFSFFFILAFTHYASFYFHPCPFLSFCFWLLPVLVWIFSSVFLIFFSPIIWHFFFYISSIFRQSSIYLLLISVLFLFTCSANFWLSSHFLSLLSVSSAALHPFFFFFFF